MPDYQQRCAEEIRSTHIDLLTNFFSALWQGRSSQINTAALVTHSEGSAPTHRCSFSVSGTHYIIPTYATHHWQVRFDW